MPHHSPIEIATANHQQVPSDWMSATEGRPLILEDPALIWLKYHGKDHGLQPDVSPYSFFDFITEKGLQFEEKWLRELAPEAVHVCNGAFGVRSVEKVQETFELMQQGTPLIAQAALWWAPERIYGVPDLLAHTSWLKTNFPDLLDRTDGHAAAAGLEGSDEPNRGDADHGGLDHYVVFDIKFTTRLDTTGKAHHLKAYGAQVRIYSYILGHLQGIMPQYAYLVTRDRIANPIPVAISSTLNQPLDQDLAALRDQVVEIKLNEAEYVPWRDEIVVSNAGHRDDQWHTAKAIIARDKVPGGDPGMLYQVGRDVKRELAAMGFSRLDLLLETDPKAIPFEQCRGLGSTTSERIRVILEANRSGSPIPPHRDLVPLRKDYEFFVDFEYFSNLNTDFERQWPALDGCEMIFMVGLGWQDRGQWAFEAFVAGAENHDGEREMLEKFIEFLRIRTDGALTDDARTSFHHWTNAEVWQAGRASDRHRLPANHPLRALPWYDLQGVFHRGPLGAPGAWNYQLKEVAKALGRVDPAFDPQWPGELDQGLRAMVIGWKAYENEQPQESQEMNMLRQYLEADCRALWQILRWMRTATA